MSPSSTQTRPLQSSLRSELEWGCAHKELVFSCTILPSSCSDSSFCARGRDHKHLVSGQGLHHVSRIPPLPHHRQPSGVWVWARSVGCFVPWCPRASSCSPKTPPACTVRVKCGQYEFLQRASVCVQALMNYSPSPNIPANKQCQFKCLLKNKGKGCKPGWAGSSVCSGTNIWGDLSPPFSQLISSFILNCLPNWSLPVRVYDQKNPIVSREKYVSFSWVKLKVMILQSLEGEGWPLQEGGRRRGYTFIRQRGHIFSSFIS